MIRYACVAAGARVLAEHEHDPDTPLYSLAAQCLLAAPKFHALYTHTVLKRIYAFLIQNQNQNQNQIEHEHQPLLTFFAIADDSLSRAKALLFLHNLRESFESKRQQHKDDHLDLHHLVLFFNRKDGTQARDDSKAHTSLTPSTSPRDLDSGRGEERRKGKKGQRRRKDGEESFDDGHRWRLRWGSASATASI